MSAPFRTLCHSLGLSAQALAALCAVQERTVRHWFADGEPPEGVLAQVMQLDAIMGRQVDAVIHQADDASQALPPGERPQISLTAYRTAEAWYAAHPDCRGLPIQTHSMMLRRVWEALQGLGYEVTIMWAEDAAL